MSTHPQYNNEFQEAAVPTATDSVQTSTYPADPSTLRYKLVQVMKAVDHVDKRGTAAVASGGYAYMKAADIAHAFRNELSQRGILFMGSVLKFDRYTVQGANRVLNGADVLMEFTFHDVASEEELSVKALGSGLDTGDKAVYKAQTGALKYALRSAFLVPDAAADAEADGTVDEETSYVKAPQRLIQPYGQEQDSWGGEETTDAPQANSGPRRTVQQPARGTQRTTQPAGKSYGAPKNPLEKISDAQRGRLFAISKSAGLSEDEVHEIIAPFGFTSTNQITKGVYDKICAIVESGGLR